jgi:hypothetical protein
MWCTNQKQLFASIASAFAVSVVLVAPVGAAPMIDKWWDNSDSRGQSSPALGQSNCLESPLASMANSGVVGSAQLCLTEQGVRANVQADNLTNGNAYTTWMVYFDNPSQCSVKPCAPADVMGDDPTGIVTRLDGLVATGGPETFAGMYHDLHLSHGGEVHIPIFGHGVANEEDHRALARQLLTPQDPGLGVMGGAAADGPMGSPVAVAIFYLP